MGLLSHRVKLHIDIYFAINIAAAKHTLFQIDLN